MSSSSENKPNLKLDVAIVGGGIAGLYAAWRRNSTNSVPNTIRIFEATPRVGGRLCSVSLPGIPLPAELGAMRYSSRHHLLINIINQLGLTPKPFNVPDPGFYLRGRRLSAQALRSNECRHCSSPIPFNLSAQEKGLLPGQLVREKIWEALHCLNFPTLSPENAKRIRERINQRNLSSKDWRWVKEHGRFKDIPLYEIGLWNLLQHLLTNEAFQLVHDGLGYESIVGNWNAAEAIDWFVADFVDQAWYMLPEGLEKVASGLEKLNRKNGVEISTEYSLERVIPLESSGGRAWQLEFATKHGTEVYETNNLILALPRRALEKLKVDHPDWNRIRHCFASVRTHRLFKLFLAYEYPWWNGLVLPGDLSGYVCTDLPIRQIYYFGPDWVSDHTNRLDEKRNFKNISLVMASYSDSHYVSFWRPLSLEQPGSSYSKEYGRKIDPLRSPRYYRWRPDLLNDEGAEQEESLLRKRVQEYGASERMVQKVHQQLAEVHGIKQENIPDPLVSIYMDWGREPYEGGWHTWEVHEKSWEIAEKVIKPIQGEAIYICGEAFSTEQGWIEGALQTTEQVLKKLSHNLVNIPSPPT